MSYRIRPATGEDFQAIYQMAKLTGGGFTNLPPDRATLVAKLDKSEKSFAREEDGQSGDLYMFVLEDPKAGNIRGTCQVFGQVGVAQPFYSYHLSTLTQSSPELGQTFRNQLLTLTTDLEGSSEVGGLFLHPELRAGGWGSLLARGRYLFIKLHRARFGERTLAELRGVMDEAGNAPFWDALAGKFFNMSFPEADEFNAVHGTKFIADLMPRTPIYVALLADAARAVMGSLTQRTRGAAHVGGGGIPLRPLCRHFRRRPDCYRAYRSDQDGARVDARDGVRGGGRRQGQVAGRGRTPQELSRLLRTHSAAAEERRVHRRRSGGAAGSRSRRPDPGRGALMLTEINFDGIIGPSHNYAGLSFGNVASMSHGGQVSEPRAAALQGIDKMRANLTLGLSQGIFLPHPRPHLDWLDRLGTGIENADPIIAANAMSASAMWAANAATVSPGPDTADGKCHLTIANLRTMPHRSHEWPSTLSQLRIAFGDNARFQVHPPSPRSATRAPPTICA